MSVFSHIVSGADTANSDCYSVSSHTGPHKMNGGTPSKGDIVLYREYSTFVLKNTPPLSLSSFGFWDASMPTKELKKSSHTNRIHSVRVCFMWKVLCPDTKPCAQTGSITHSLYNLCVLEPESWTSVSHKHPSWQIILSSVSNFNSVNNTNTEILDPSPSFHQHILTDIPTLVQCTVSKHYVINLWLVIAHLNSVNTVQP